MSGGAGALRYRLGIDIGGTFTDFSVLDTESGEGFGFKTPTVPADPARGIADGLRQLAARGVDPREIDYVVHGTTIALNSVIQRSGARVALLVTEGFRDVFELARLRLPVTWNFYGRRPAPLVPRELVVPVRERLRHGGGVEVPLESAEIERVVEHVSALEPEGVAICLLHSYANPVHELALRDALAEGGLFVSCSSSIWPQMREYERALVAAMNAYVRPPMVRYLSSLEAVLRDAGVTARPYITRSNGGIMTTGAAKEEAVQTLLSGPASGVIGAADVAVRAGFLSLLTLDMGGTSADVAVVADGRIADSHEERVGDFPIILPAVGISSIGAGGGSTAWLDGAGVLKIGPESAGADPGPACYGRGGERPALSDAFLLCGYLNPERFAGGLTLDAEAARQAIGTIAGPLGLSVSATATAIVRVALANMFGELSGVLDRRGLDARDFTLVAFGGAGPLVGCLLAEELNVRRVLVPTQPGTLCALGALKADVMTDVVRTLNARLDGLDGPALAAAFAEPVARAEAWLAHEAPSFARSELNTAAEMRYVGQAYEIEVPVDAGALESDGLYPLEAAFHALHERLYFHADTDAPAEIVDLRVRAIGYLPRSPAQRRPRPVEGAPTPIARREIVLGTSTQTAAVYDRERLVSGHVFEGPAVVEQTDTTTLVPPGWRAAVDPDGNLVATLGG